MNPDDEFLLEQYVRRPGSLEESDRQAAERLVAKDAGAHAYLSFLQAFYEQLDAEAERPPDARVEAFVDELFEDAEATVIDLEPFQAPREARPTVLAAETETSADERRFSVLTTLASEAAEVLVRIVKDRDTDRGRLYVLADPPEKRAHVVVSLPGLGLDLVADEEGRLEFDLPAGVEAEQWAEARAVVRRPVAADELAPSASTSLALPAGGTLRCRRESGTLTATPGDDASVPSLLTVASGDPPPRLLRFQSATPVRCEVEKEGPIVLRVYE